MDLSKSFFPENQGICLFFVKKAKKILRYSGFSAKFPPSKAMKPDRTTAKTMKTQDLLKKIENQVAAMQDAIEAEQSPVRYPWMIETTQEEADAAKSIKIAHHAAEVIKINKAITALANGKTVTENAFGDFEIA